MMSEGKSITLTEDEANMLCTALALVTPTGGGGPENSLGLRLSSLYDGGPPVPDALHMQFWHTALAERYDAGAPFNENELNFAVDVLAETEAKPVTGRVDATAAFNALVHAAAAYRNVWALYDEAQARRKAAK